MTPIPHNKTKAEMAVTPSIQPLIGSIKEAPTTDGLTIQREM